MPQDTESIIDKIVSEKKLSGQWPLTQLLSILQALSEHDVMIEAKRASNTKRLMFAVIGLVVGIILVFFVRDSWPDLFFLPLALVVILVIGIIWGAILSMKYSRSDLPNEFREYLQPFLENLQDDIKPDSPVGVELMMSPVEKKEFGKGKSDKYSVGVYHSCYDHYFERDFLGLKLRLTDGNRLLLSGKELLIKTSKTKRNPRGKYKTKTKYKKRVTFDVRIIASSDAFQAKPLPQEGEPKLYAKETNGNMVVGMKFTEKLKGDPKTMIPNPLVTLQQLVTLYSFLQTKSAA